MADYRLTTIVKPELERSQAPTSPPGGETSPSGNGTWNGVGVPGVGQSQKSGGSEQSVYSFCMCPGGQIVPTSTTPDELSINGMSFR